MRVYSHIGMLLTVSSIAQVVIAQRDGPRHARSLRSAKRIRRAEEFPDSNEANPTVFDTPAAPLEERGDLDWSSLTFFQPGLGACGKHNTAGDFIVALNQAQWDNGAHCWKMINIDYAGKSLQAQIVDLCPGCKPGGLDLSPAVFNSFASPDEGNIFGSWTFLDDSTTSSQAKSTGPSSTMSASTTHHPHGPAQVLADNLATTHLKSVHTPSHTRKHKHGFAHIARPTHSSHPHPSHGHLAKSAQNAAKEALRPGSASAHSHRKNVVKTLESEAH